ncbi:A-kinase anchor protein 1, mitochondrial [Aptenodytes patagonicus]|uniref:A-kinase anchor protein 1, mitochondrial n=1 Tax=Aptenodytes patagonicus TaxID=9234 RepID=UPI003FA0904D
MAFRFRSVIPYAIPGVLALLGCWWMYSHRKKYASYHDEQAIAAEEEQQEEVPENDSSPKTEACVPQEGTSDEEYPENETSTSLLSAGSTPSLLCQTHERPDLSQDLPDLSVMTVQPSTFEDDSEKLETMKTQDESSVPACVSLPLISKSTECHSSAAVSLIQDSSSSANQDQWPSASVTLTQKSLGITEISNAEQSDDSSFKPPEESQMPEIVAGSVTALCLGLEKEDKTPQAFLNIEVVSSHKDSAVSMLPDSLESACLEQSREEDMSESIASTVPVCQEDTQPKGDELEREKIAGVSLDKEEVEKIEQVAIQIISKVIFAATEEVLSGSAGDVSTQTCQAAASQVERPLETASVVSPAQMLAEEATVADENIAAKGDAAVLTSPQSEEQGQSVTDSSCSTDSCLSGPVQGDTEDRQVKNRVCSEEVLSGSAGDVSTQTCQAAASQVERPLETASVVSPAQMLAEEATVADENIAAKGDAAVLTSPQTEEQDQSVTDSSCLTDSCLSGPVQGDTEDRQVKNRVCSEEVLSGSAGDVSTQTCQAAASQVERPLETASVVSPAQMLAEEATVADENIAAKGDAAVLTSPQSEEQGQSVTDSSCSTDSCLSGPVQGDTKDRQVKNRVCSEEVLSGSAGDVSTRTCQAAASQVERPLETASVVSPAQMLAEEATVADENIAAKGDAAVLTSPQTEEQDQSVTDSSCLTDSCLSGPVQGDTEDRQVKNRVCSEEVLAGSAGDVSTRTCRAAASQVERPLETASVVSPAQMLAEEATVADENIAAKGDAAVLTSPQSEEQGQSVTDSSCLTDSCLSGPVQGDTKDRQVKNRVCSESQGVDRTPVENHGGSLEKSPVVMEDFGCNTYTSEGGTSVEDSLQNTMLSVTSGQRSDSLSISATQDTSAEQTSVPSEKPPTLKLPEDSKVPYTNGILKDDGPDLRHECSRAAQMDGDHSGGLDANSMDFMDSGCAMRKTVTHQNCKLGGESSKSDFVIWEVEVPKELVGRLIGKQGRYMSFLRQASGAKIYVSTLPYFRDSQVCHIEGSPQQVEKVLSLIGQKFKELCLTNIYALPPPTPLTLHSLLMTAWLFLPDGVTVEVVVANQVDAGHMFLQQHTHPTFHVLRSLDQQMYACYSQPEIPTLPTPVEVGIICAAPGLDGAWLRAQVISYFEETNEVELRYVDYGGYDKVKIDTLRQIRSDFLSLPFQGAEVLLDNVVPLPDEDHFSSEADAAVSEMTTGAVLVAQVTNYDSATGLPLIQLWNLMGDEVVSINRTLVERGFAQWLDY